MGISLANQLTITNVNQLLRLWGHELTRVFSDRMNTKEDKEWFKESVE